MSAEKSIPARPSLEQYRKQAKDLVKSRALLQPEVFERIRRHHPRLSELSEAQLRAAAFTLADAQLVLAREHAFKTWPEFMRHLASPRPQEQVTPPVPARSSPARPRSAFPRLRPPTLALPCRIGKRHPTRSTYFSARARERRRSWA